MDNHPPSNNKENQSRKEPQIWEMNEANPKPADDRPQNPPQKWYKKVAWKEVLETVAVIVGIAVCKIYWDQLQVMSRQLSEMQGSSVQTSQLIVNAAHQASGIHDLAVAAGKQADQASIQARAARASADAAKSASQTAKETLRMAYRPWINAESAKLTKPLVFPPSQRFYLAVNIVLKNTGTSVAINGLMMPDAEPDYTAILTTNAHRVCDYARDMRTTKAKTTPWETGFVLAPGDTVPVPVGMGSDNISPEQIRKGQFYILGCVIYTDQYRIDHHTQFCFQPDGLVTDPAAIKFRACDWYGDAD